MIAVIAVIARDRKTVALIVPGPCSKLCQPMFTKKVQPQTAEKPERAALKNPPILYDRTQKVIHEIESKLGERLITYWNSPSGSICSNDVVGLYGILGSMGKVAEGVTTTRAVHERAGRMGIDMPITAAVHSVLYEGKHPRDAVNDLMLRSPKGEH